MALGAVLSAGCSGPGLASADPSGRQVAYVSVRGDGRVAVYDVDAENGEWALKQTVFINEGDEGWAASAPISVSPDGRRLDVGLRGAGSVATYEIAPDGTLSLLGTADIGGSAPYLSRDRSGRWLLAAYYVDGKVSVHRIGADGAVVGGAVQEIRTGANAHSIMTDPSNRFALVPHTGANAIEQFRFDAETGRLSPNTPPRVEAGVGRGPRHHRYHPTLPIVYAINETGSSITAYRFDPEAGTLAELQEVPTLPGGYTETNSTADLHLTPDGSYLYGSNRGHDSLVAYRVDPSSGLLEVIGWFDTEQIPRSFAIDRRGRHLYVAGQGSGNVAGYRIDPASGRLTRFATYEVGEAPTWIELLALEWVRAK